MTPLVSVVVLAWNNEDVIGACLDSVAKLEWDALEVIVVDNGSTDGTPAVLRARQDIKVVTLPKNRGFAGGQVAAAPYVRGEFVALVNSDAVVSPTWLAELMAEMSDGVGAAGGRAYDWDGTESGLVRGGFYSFQVIDPVIGAAATMRSGDVPTDVNSISGAAVLIRAEAMRAVGGFDKRFFCYYEETDLFARMRRAGWRVRYVPTAEVWHQMRASSRATPGFYEFYMFRNRALCALKNFDREFVFPFLVRYVDHVRAGLRRGGHDRRLVIRALLQLLLLTPHILRTRRRLARGRSYNRSLVLDTAPIVTVAITSYNHAEYVSAAIESALGQGRWLAEVIVVDDGSTDDSWAKIEAFGNRVRAVRKANGGVISARNEALRLCNSEWLVYLDSDDLLPEGYVERLLAEARLRALDVAYGDAVFFGAQEGLLAGEPFDRLTLADHNFIHCSALVRREHVLAVGGFKSAMAGGYEDWELYMSLYELGSSFGYVQGVALRYRRHGQIESRNIAAGKSGEALRELVRGLHPRVFAPPEHVRLKSTLAWRALRALLGPLKRRLRHASFR
jgi:GT2 family glycosyltransferase